MILKRAPKSCWNDTCYISIITGELINFIVKNRVQQAVVPCIFLSFTTAPAQLLWNLNWGLQQDKKDSQVLWCYRDTRHCQKASHATNRKRNLYAKIWRRFPLKLWPAWLQASENTSIHFTVTRSENEENTSLTCPHLQDKKPGEVSHRQAQLIPSLQATGQGCLCTSM